MSSSSCCRRRRRSCCPCICCCPRRRSTLTTTADPFQPVSLGRPVNWNGNTFSCGRSIKHAPNTPYILLRSCRCYIASFSISIENDLALAITACLQFQVDGVNVGSPTTATIPAGITQTVTGTVGIQTCGQNMGMSMMDMMGSCNPCCCDPCSSSVLTLVNCTSPSDPTTIPIRTGTLTVMRQPGRCGGSGCGCGGSRCDCC